MVSYDDQTLRRLLDLQAEDTAMARLRERRASLPEAARLAEVNDLLSELDADLTIAHKQNDEIAREQTRFEDQIALIDSKTAREEQRMMSGQVTNPKELSALQEEVAGFKRRRSGIEDELLEVMVQREGSEATVDKLTKEKEQAAAEKEELTAAVGRLSGDIDAELSEHEAKRQEVAATLPEDLLALYEKIRTTKHGVGAASLTAGTCSGCHTKLPAIEAERIRKERGLQRCDNCRRILVVV